MDFKMEFKFTTKPYILLLVVSAVLFITIFLPWWSANYDVMYGIGFNYSINGFHNGGVLTFLMSLVGIGLAFVSVQRTRALLSIAAGILALLGAVISVASLSGFGVGFGLIIAIIVSLGLATVGYLEYRKLSPSAKPAQPPQAPPPATPPVPPPPPPAPPKQ